MQPDNPANTGPLNTVRRRNRKNFALAATGALVIVTAGHGTAGEPPKVRAVDTSPSEPIRADPVALDFPRTAVGTVPAPPSIAAPPAETAPPRIEPKKEVAPVPKAVPKKPVVIAPPKPAPAPPAPKPVVPPAPPASGYVNGALVASAALGQLGRRQDCTRLVTNSLAAVGIAHHGWPISYTALGDRVAAADAQPGDIIYYVNGGMGLAHIAVYIGNGMAVHGGWNGNQTVTFKANVGSGPIYVRVRSK